MRGIDTSRLVWRLFLAMTLVVWSGAITMLIVATLVAPQVFHRHLGMVSAQLPDDLQTHVDNAFGQAVLFSLGVGVFAGSGNAAGEHPQQDVDGVSGAHGDVVSPHRATWTLGGRR